MSIAEQIWFSVGIAGFVILLDGTINYVGQKIWPRTNPNFIRAIGGVLIYVLAVIMLLRMV